MWPIEEFQEIYITFINGNFDFIGKFGEALNLWLKFVEIIIANKSNFTKFFLAVAVK